MLYNDKLININVYIIETFPLRLLLQDFYLFALIYIVPLLFFILPQFVSRLITSLAFWLAKDEVKRLWIYDPHFFDTFTTSWKRVHGLMDDICRWIDEEKVVTKGCKRSIWTIISLIFFIYFPIYVIITEKIVETYILSVLSATIIFALISIVCCLKDCLSKSS